jgi:hypothetical protein
MQGSPLGIKPSWGSVMGGPAVLWTVPVVIRRAQYRDSHSIQGARVASFLFPYAYLSTIGFRLFSSTGRRMLYDG